MRAADNTVRWGFVPLLCDLLRELDALYRGWGDELVITSGSEHTAEHSSKSLHYAGRAADIRIWERAMVPSVGAQLSVIRDAVKRFCALRDIPSTWFDIVLEDTHIHIELQPKGGGASAIDDEVLALLGA